VEVLIWPCVIVCGIIDDDGDIDNRIIDDQLMIWWLPNCWWYIIIMMIYWYCIEAEDQFIEDNVATMCALCAINGRLAYWLPATGWCWADWLAAKPGSWRDSASLTAAAACEEKQKLTEKSVAFVESQIVMMMARVLVTWRNCAKCWSCGRESLIGDDSDVIVTDTG